MLKSTLIRSLFSLALLGCLIDLNFNTALGTHTLTASPSGGTYTSAQTVILESSEPAALIFYTLDGTEPDLGSIAFNGTAIEISGNITLKYMAIDPADNHTSTVQTEEFIIDTLIPSVIATPPGGSYSSSQSVTLQSLEPATIYYAVDGSEPDTNSTLFSDSLIINTTTTLKFFAVDLAGNQSPTITEVYLFAPQVTDVDPSPDATRVDINSNIKATFSQPMNASTISTDTFVVTDEFGSTLSGTVTYNSTMNAAFFAADPFSIMKFGTVHTATLTDEIEDQAGNNIATFNWNFTTGGQIQILLFDVHRRGIFPGNLIPGSAFTITPNPFTLENSLLVEDNGEFDSKNTTNGFIAVDNVDFSTYVITETTVPENFVEMYDNHLLTIIHTNIRPAAESVTIENRDPLIPLGDISQPIRVPAPDLNPSQFDLYKDNATPGIFSGVQGDSLLVPTPIDYVGPNTIPIARFATIATLGQIISTPIFSVLFSSPSAAAGSTAQELFDSFQLPTYPAPAEDIAAEIFYIPPAFVIPFEDSQDNFVLTPVLEKVFPGMTLRLQQPSFVESQVAKVEQVNMTFAIEASNVGFSFGISDVPPPGTPTPPLDAPALFLDIGFVGNGDFSNPDSFQASPKIDVLVNKTLPGFPELPNGCPDFKLLFFDGDDWIEVQKLNPTGNFTDFCPFTLEPEHFSKFAVGGVKGTIVATEAILAAVGGGGGGRDGNSATSIQQMISGEEVVVTTGVGSESVTSQFELVEPGSGQLKIESDPVTRFEELFDEITVGQRETEKQGIVHLNDAIYSTVGTVFDIDSSDVNFSGTFNVTIPYKEHVVLLSLGSESDVRLLHYSSELRHWEDITISLDEVANTVTGRMMNSSSPVVAALIGDTPVETIGISSIALSNTNLNSQSWQVSSREQVTLSVTMNNIEELSSSKDQSIMFIMQTLDEDGVVVDISLQTVILEIALSGELTESWVEDDPGMYRIQILIWSSLDEPESLSDAAFTPMIKVIQ